MTKFKIDRNDNRALYMQIKDCLYNAIQNGELKEGERLPSVVGFAKEFGVTQATINRALEDLSKEGWITSHVGRGTFVSHPKEKENTKIKEVIELAETSLTSSSSDFITAARRVRLSVAQSLEALEAFIKPDLINFTSGFPDPSIAKEIILHKITEKAFKKFGQKVFQSYTNIQGLEELRNCIAERYRQSGVKIDSEQILITNGSQQGISLIAHEALESKRRIICETPSYKGAFNAFNTIGHWVETLPREIDGPILSHLEKYKDNHSSVIYLGSEFHNPMGTDISNEKSLALAEWAKNNNSYLLSDEIFRDLRFEGKKKESLLTIAGTENSVIVSSLSKSFMGGLRIGWMVTNKERIKSLLLLKRSIDISTPPLMQAIASILLTTGEYDKHLEAARNHYKIRRDATLDALTKYMPDGIKWTVPEGGFHLWCELPEGYSSIALYLLAVNKGVLIKPGPHFDLDHRFLNAFNLGYGSLETDKIYEGIELLSDAVKELLRAPSGDFGLNNLGSFI